MKKLQKFISLGLIMGWLIPCLSVAQSHYPLSILPIPDFHIEALPNTYSLIEKSAEKSTNIKVLYLGSSDSYDILRYRVRGLIIDEFPLCKFKVSQTELAKLNKSSSNEPLADLYILQVQDIKSAKRMLKALRKADRSTEAIILFLPENTSISAVDSKSRKKALALSKKNEVGFIDVPPNWNKYVEENKLSQEEMFRKGKINDHGEYVLAGIIYQYLMLPF